jgi:hypothetical protein
MPLKKALKYWVYLLSVVPTKVQRKLPGNIGQGTSSVAAVNIRKKITRIILLRIVVFLQL